MGRVSAAVEVVLGTFQAISIVVGALVVSLVDYHVMFLVMGAVQVVAIAYLWLALLRTNGRRPSPEVVPVVPETD